MRPAFLFKLDRQPRGAPIPPPNFIPAGDPRDVRLIDYTHDPQRLSAARKAGIRYEEKWHTFASQFLGRRYRSFRNKLFAFSDTSGQRCCRPDGILIPEHKDWFVIFEVKVGHISDSYWQLRHLYEPVLSKWSHCSSRRAVVVEVCRRFDPATFYPCATKHLSILDLEDYFALPQNPAEVGVLIWKDK